MKLKCHKHDRRVLTGKDSFLHRTGDMSKCDSPVAQIGTLVIPFSEINIAFAYFDLTRIPEETQS